jgi:F0F1-type ATP synthase membrane subunit b/b'
MRFWTAYAFITITIATKAWSAPNAGGDHGSVSDLIAPAVNVAILVGFLVWKLKTPLRDYFNKMSEDVANTLERASIKSKEAQLMLESEERKAAALESELKAINQQAETDVSTFEKNLSKEVDEKSHKLKADASAKIQADKKAMMDKLNAELLDQVIKQTKSTIKTNKDFQSKASTKLLQRL